MTLSRREWLQTSWGLLLLPEILAAQEHAHQAASSSAPPAFTYLNPADARDIEALTSRIIPSDDSPGAREAGVVYFIDRALATFDQERRNVYRDGLVATQAKRRELFPASQTIAGLSPQQQDELLRAIEQTPFFAALRFHTLAGFLGSPSHGGNRDGIGWKFIGFEDKPRHDPPFGYYDREIQGGR